MVEPPAGRLGMALGAYGALLANVRDDQWSNATPCPDWDVRQLVNHVVSGNRIFAAIMRGEQLPPSDELARLRSEDVLGDDPLTAYRAAGSELVTAFADPAVLDRVVQAPAGRVPGLVVLHLRVTELLVHGWDLAHATGQAGELPQDLAEEEIAFTRRMFDGGVPRAGRFAEVTQVADDAPALDRLAAELGRDVRTGSPGSVS
jgi:uncharacterized protein (TIGR03086 family)